MVIKDIKKYFKKSDFQLEKDGFDADSPLN